jgi:FeS assembly SUF system protein
MLFLKSSGSLRIERQGSAKCIDLDLRVGPAGRGLEVNFRNHYACPEIDPCGFEHLWHGVRGKVEKVPFEAAFGEIRKRTLAGSPRSRDYVACNPPGNARRNQMALTRDRVMEALRQCYDPEIPVNIVDLGLIYDVELDDAGNVRVKMTLTSQGCPSALAIPEQVKLSIGAIEEVRDVAVDLVWEPPWNPSMISDAAKQQLGLDV